MMKSAQTCTIRGWWLISALCLSVAGAVHAAELRVDTKFPGGNGIIERIEGDNVYLQADCRETRGRWFYWCIRVRDAGTRTLTFHFTLGTPIGVRGPAVSTDGGLTWTWLGAELVKGNSSFSYPFTAGPPEVLFSVGMTYTERNLHAFIARIGKSPHFKVESLGRSDRGRNVELFRAGKLDGTPVHRVALTARHHACEMMASYELEGIIEAILADDTTGRWLRENVEFLIVPMVDKDAVEDGLQGKNRLPHDTGRDYFDAPIYASVAALKKRLSEWADGRLRIAIDLHCPSLRGPTADNIYFVGGPDPINGERVSRLSGVLERVQKGPLVFRAKDNVPHGMLWNKLQDPRSFARWAAELPGVHIGTTIEIPFASVRGVKVNAASANLFGRDVAAALREYLATELQR
jgi:hypothetical protein